MTLIVDGAAPKKRGRPPKHVTKAEAAATPPDLSDLPPPGAARTDALKARADALQEAIETAPHEHEALDPSRYKPIREVQHMLRESIHERHPDQPISGALPDYDYCLVRCKEPGSQVRLKETQQVYDSKTGSMAPVWEVVSGTMPEMLERKDVYGYRVIADTLLMRARKDRLAAWREHEILAANRHSRQSQAELLEQARRTRGVRVVETSLPDPDGLTVTPSKMRDALVHQLGAKLATEQLKTGTVPGMEAR